MTNIPFFKRSASKSAYSQRKTRWFYVFIMPWLLGFIFLTAVPLIAAFGMSFTNYTGFNSANLRFVGLDNYVTALRDTDALYALGRTFTFALLNIPLNIILSLSIALMLTQRIFMRGLFRTLFYIPSIIPIVAVAWIWKLMMDNNFGLVNGLLDTLMPGTYVRWMTENATFVLVMLTLWAGTGGAIVIFLAAFQGVPEELEEAARIDGANGWQIFMSITIPIVTPVIFYQMILGLIGSFQVLAEPLLLAPASLSGSGLSATPPRDNYVYMVYVYNQIFTQQRFGYGSALLWLLFILILLLTLVVFRSGRYWVYYEVDQEKNPS